MFMLFFVLLIVKLLSESSVYYEFAKNRGFIPTFIKVVYFNGTKLQSFSKFSLFKIHPVKTYSNVVISRYKLPKYAMYNK